MDIKVKNAFNIDFIGIGATKCATTWIYKCLEEHPQICGSSIKEINFFNIPFRYKKGIEYYKKFFEHCRENQVRGEFSSEYFWRPEVPKRIYDYFPNVKLILSLRDPRERAYSHYRFSKRIQGRVGNYKSFEDAILKSEPLRDTGFYAKHLKDYFEYFSREQILILFFEDIKKNPKDVIQRIYKFLEVDSTFLPTSVQKKVNPTGSRRKRVKLPILNSLAYKIWDWAERRCFSEKFFTKTGLRKTGRRIILKNKESYKSEKPEKTSLSELSKETKQYLDSLYKEDIEDLEKLLNRDLNSWK